MNQIQYNQDGTVSALFTTQDGTLHHFHFPVSHAGYVKNTDGSDNLTLVTTGTITCTDPGCGMTICTTFPLTGDGVSQQAHCMYRYATSGGTLTLQQAAQAVIADVEAAGETPRIDGNGQVL